MQQIVDNMMVLAANSTKEKLEAFEALIVEMKKSGGFMNGVTQVETRYIGRCCAVFQKYIKVNFLPVWK